MLGLPPNTWKSLNDIPELSDLASMMRNTFQLAAAFSPLIVLMPKKPSIDGIRDHLLAVGFNFLFLESSLIDCWHQHAIVLGNGRPSTLKLVENVLWKTLLNIAAGMDVQVELESFSTKATSLIQIPWSQIGLSKV